MDLINVYTYKYRNNKPMWHVDYQGPKCLVGHKKWL